MKIKTVIMWTVIIGLGILLCIGLLWVTKCLTEGSMLADIVTTILIPLVIGTLATFIALIITYHCLRPKIEINKKFVLNNDGELEFCFKNNSLYRIYNLQIFLKSVKRENGIDECERNIDLEDRSIAHVAGKLEGDTQRRTICVNTLGDLNKDSISHLRLIVSAQHPLSGITEIATQDFEYEKVINGEFVDGVIIPDGISAETENNQTN